MSASFGTTNPLAWVHFQLRGGWKRTFAFTIGGVIVVGVLMMMSVVRSGPTGSYSGTMEGWAQGLVLLEAAILILYGAAAVAGAIRNDIAAGLIESHRLMPVSAPRAVVGYLLGGGASALVLAGGVIFLDLFAALASHVPLDRWLISQVSLAGLTGLIWLMAAMGAFVGRLGGNLLIAFIVVGFFGSQFMFAFFPGLLMLVIPSLGRISLMSWGQAETLIPIALLLQALLAVLFFIGAVRRYARDDVSCFGIIPGMGLAALWCVMSILGITHYQTLLTNRYDQISLPSQCISSLLILLILSLVPLANAARAAAHPGTSLFPRRDRVLPMIVIAVALVLTTTLTFPMYRPTDSQFWMKTAQTLVIAAAWLVAMRFLLGWVYLATNGGFMIGFVWMLLVWFAPMVGDVIMQSVMHPNEDYVAGWLFAASPLGALMQIWSPATGQNLPEIVPGLAIQIGLILIPLLLFSRRRKPKLIKPAAAV
jgi:hypothetical protein